LVVELPIRQSIWVSFDQHAFLNNPTWYYRFSPDD
jgi:hypothetical protein